MISVLMPVYNSENYIAFSIKSILNQTNKHFEFIIINDGSTDNSEKIIKSFNDGRIKYFVRKHQGISETLNYGLTKCSGELVARMDADDIAEHQRLEIQFKFMCDNPEYDVVSSWYALFQNQKIKYIIRTGETDNQIKKRLALHSEIVHPGVMYRKKIIQKYGYNLDSVEDYDLWLRIKNEAKFHNIQKVLTFLRLTKNSLSRSNLMDIQAKHYSIQIPYYKNLKNNFGELNRIQEIQVRGWREYFYGEKSEAKRYWNENNLRSVYNFKILFALLTTYLPDKIYHKIRSASVLLRIKYHLNYFSKINTAVRKSFKKIITNLEANSNIDQ